MQSYNLSLLIFQASRQKSHLLDSWTYSPTASRASWEAMTTPQMHPIPQRAWSSASSGTLFAPSCSSSRHQVRAHQHKSQPSLTLSSKFKCILLLIHKSDHNFQKFTSWMATYKVQLSGRRLQEFVEPQTTAPIANFAKEVALGHVRTWACGPHYPFLRG